MPFLYWLLFHISCRAREDKDGNGDEGKKKVRNQLWTYYIEHV